MSIRSLTISLPEPCSENWQQMTPTGCGRFCAACQKTVIDFTGMTDGEVIKIFEQQTNVCGRFSDDQLGRELVAMPADKGYYVSFAQKIAASLLVASSFCSNAIAQQAKKTAKATIAAKQETGIEALHNHVFGYILAPDNKTPFSDIKVNAYEPVTKVLLGSGVSDARGAVKIDLGLYPGDTVLLKIAPERYIDNLLAIVSRPNAVSYFTINYPLPIARDTLPETETEIVTRQPTRKDTIHSSGGIVSIEVTESSRIKAFWQRIKRLFEK